MSARSVETPLGLTFGIDNLYNQFFPTPSPATVAPLVMKDVEVVEMDGAAVEGGLIEKPHGPSSEPKINTTRRHRQSSHSSRSVLLPSASVSTISSGLTVSHTTAGNGGSWSDEDEQAWSVSTDNEVELESGVDDQTGSLHVHRPARRTNSTRTGGKCHYSAYRRRIQSISQLQQLQLKLEENQDQQ
ncbi:hypothetical protein BGW39_002064 [Mortierella sp. 14UC]|nr:hypothetical protein BGW39_002064 [Mortierella sp. 14UC]